jgi:hypothetical protein
MAIGLVLLAGLIALPVAVLAGATGFTTFWGAVWLFCLIGWSVILAGFLADWISWLIRTKQPEKK